MGPQVFLIRLQFKVKTLLILTTLLALVTWTTINLAPPPLPEYKFYNDHWHNCSYCRENGLKLNNGVLPDPLPGCPQMPWPWVLKNNEWVLNFF